MAMVFRDQVTSRGGNETCISSNIAYEHRNTAGPATTLAVTEGAISRSHMDEGSPIAFYQINFE